MKTIHFMNHTGDREVSFDETPELAAIRDQARHDFNRALLIGYRAFKVDRANGKPDELVSSFDELENRTILVAPIRGG